MQKKDISTARRNRIFKTLTEALSKRDEIIFAYVHGSFLEGVLFNDIDVALYIKETEVSREKESGYCDDLSLDLSGRIGFTADVHIMNHAPVGFQHGVFKHGRLLFSKDDELRSDLIEETSMETMLFYEHSLEYIRDIVYHGH